WRTLATAALLIGAFVRTLRHDMLSWMRNNPALTPIVDAWLRCSVSTVTDGTRGPPE
ncbi:MAG: hypothetical protein MHM6MM_009538, partial [Cercozoa sp. M6MM]